MSSLLTRPDFKKIFLFISSKPLPFHKFPSSFCDFFQNPGISVIFYISSPDNIMSKMG